MKISKKIISVLLAVVMLFSCSATALCADTESAATDKGIVYKGIMTVLGSVVDGLIDTITALIPTPFSWFKNDANDETGLMKGTDTFLNEPCENAVFSLGYDKSNLLENVRNDIIGNMYVAGSIALKDKKAEAVLDDSYVRTVAFQDGSSRGTSVLLVLDAYGISLPDVREIRSRLAGFANENGINSITVSVLHQHSVIDTLGMNGNILQMAFLNPITGLFGGDTPNGKNDEYMENLFNVCVNSVKNAVSRMTPGSLYYGTADQTPYLSDKRAPFVCDGSFNRFRFVPDNESKETWLISTEIHCVGNGVQGKEVTSDYPAYAEKAIQEVEDANVMFYMGAQQSTTQEHNVNTVENYSEDMTGIQQIEGFGRSIGKTILAIENEKEIAPLINIRYKQITVPLRNGVLLAGGKANLFGARVVRQGLAFAVVTEIGYMELGTDLAFAIIPGELAPEIAYGGALQGDAAWTGKTWDYPSMSDIVSQSRNGRKLMVLDLANDMIGYILPDNNYMPIIAEESQSIELVSLGNKTGSTIISEFNSLIADIE